MKEVSLSLSRLESDQGSIRRWVEHLQGQPIGPERLRCHYSALKFLCGRTLGQPEKVSFLSMPRKDAPLPTVLTTAEVQRVLDGFLEAKYRVFFALIYATGLRIPWWCQATSETDLSATLHPNHVFGDSKCSPERPDTPAQHAVRHEARVSNLNHGASLIRMNSL
jgi:site-specific recombinase XerD